MKFNKYLIMKPNTVVSINSGKQLKKLLEWTENERIKDKNGCGVMAFNHRIIGNAINLYTGGWESLSWYKERNHTVLEFEDVLVKDDLIPPLSLCGGIKPLEDRERTNIHPLKNPNSRHYEIWDDVESIDIIEKMLTKDELIGACKFNILKYQLRTGKKDDVKKEQEKIKTYQDYLKFLKG